MHISVEDVDRNDWRSDVHPAILQVAVIAEGADVHLPNAPDVPDTSITTMVLSDGRSAISSEDLKAQSQNVPHEKVRLCIVI